MAVHLAQGTYRKDRHGPAPEAPATGTERTAGVKRPSGLSADAGRFWDSIVAELTARGVLQPTDAPAAQLLADIWGKLQAASRAADKDPTDQESRRAMVAYCGEFARLASRFGLTPSDRARLMAATPSDQEARKQAEIETRYFGG